MNSKSSTPRHIIIKKIKTEEQQQKSKRIFIRLSADFLAEILLQTRRCDILNSAERKKKNKTQNTKTYNQEYFTWQNYHSEVKKK